MKKLIALTLALLMLTMSFVACAGIGDDAGTSEPVNNDGTTAPEADQTTEEVTEEVLNLPYSSAIELLTMIYEGYNAAQATDDTKIGFIGGGNTYNPDTLNYEGPGAFIALADTDYDENLGIPAAEASKIASAASMFNLMNTNNFNCYTIQFNAGTDVDASINAIKENILGRQWICGAPEKLVIVKCPGDYILVVWGAVQFGGIVDPFAASIPTIIDGATVAVEHTFAE